MCLPVPFTVPVKRPVETTLRALCDPILGSYPPVVHTGSEHLEEPLHIFRTLEGSGIRNCMRSLPGFEQDLLRTITTA